MNEQGLDPQTLDLLKQAIARRGGQAQPQVQLQQPQVPTAPEAPSKPMLSETESNRKLILNALKGELERMGKLDVQQGQLV